MGIRRPTSEALAGLCESILSERRPVDTVWTQTATGDEAALEALGGASDAPDLSVLAEEIGAAVATLESLLGCSGARVRLQSLRRPMCPRFHADQVPCRLLVTLIGPGTEWIESEHAEAVVHDAAGGADGADGHIRAFATESWSLLKGGPGTAAFVVCCTGLRPWSASGCCWPWIPGPRLRAEPGRAFAATVA